MHRQMQRQMFPPAAVTAGNWWRFSFYQIERGCICPRPGAQLVKYNPWAMFSGARAMTVGQAPTGVQPGYQSLIKLVNELKHHPGPRRYPICLTEESQKLILKWCSQYGLLGILLSRWEGIRLAPQQDTPVRRRQRRYFRGFGQAIQRIETSGDLEGAKASALIHGLNDLNTVEEAPRETWSRFFPSVSLADMDTFNYPEPYTDEFFQSYGEPLNGWACQVFCVNGHVFTTHPW